MRHTRTSIDNVSEFTLNDYWNEETEVTVSEEWIGTTRFQMWKTKLSEGYKRVDTIWPE